MKTGARGYANIKSFETLELRAYPDPISKGDPWTIGWGSTGSDVKEGVIWSPAKAEQRLISFVEGLERELNEALAAAGAIGITLQSQFDAMISFAYNIRGGVATLVKSSIFKAHVRGDRAAAAAAFKLYSNARNPKGKLVPVAGLVRRRAAEAGLYLEDMPLAPTAAETAQTSTNSPGEAKPLKTNKTVIGSVGIAAAGAGQVLVENVPSLQAAHTTVQQTGGFEWVARFLGLLIVLGALFIAYQQFAKRRKGEG